MITAFRNISVFLLMGFISLCIISCKEKDKSNDPNPIISTTPAIELISVKPSTIHQLKDSLTFTIKYTDGDGDLGFEDADSLSLYVTDTRFPLTTSYHVQPLSPGGTVVAITGQLPIVLKHIILKNPSASSESAIFNIQLKDRAGHYSNTVTTGSVTVLP